MIIHRSNEKTTTKKNAYPGTSNAPFTCCAIHPTLWHCRLFSCREPIIRTPTTYNRRPEAFPQDNLMRPVQVIKNELVADGNKHRSLG